MNYKPSILGMFQMLSVSYPFYITNVTLQAATTEVPLGPKRNPETTARVAHPLTMEAQRLENPDIKSCLERKWR